MLLVVLNKPLKRAHEFHRLRVAYERVPRSRWTAKARKRMRRRGNRQSVPKIGRWVRVADDTAYRLLLNCPDVAFVEREPEPEPLYNPTDPSGLNYAWTKQTLTHATNTTAFDSQQGEGAVIGVVESASNGADITDSELGGTGNYATDLAAVQADTHAKFVPYTDANSTFVNPHGSGHGDGVVRQAVSVMDNANAYCGSAPDAKVMLCVGEGFSDAIMRMADLGVDVISVSYSSCYFYRTAIQYAVAAGVVVVYAHGSNTHANITEPYQFEAITVGGFSESDVSDRSYGKGLTVVGRGPSGSTESHSTPAVAGIVALLIAENPTWSVYDIYASLIQTCQKPSEMGSDAWHIQYGWGIPDATAALALEQTDLKPLPPIDVSLSETDGAVTLTWVNRATTHFDHFEVRCKVASAPENASDGVSVYTGSALTCTDTVHWDATHYYAVFGVDDQSRASDVVDDAVESTAPYGLNPITSIVSSGTSLTVSWELLSGADGYRVYWDTDSGTPYANSTDVGAVGSCEISDLTDGQVYYIKVDALSGEDVLAESAVEQSAIVGGADIEHLGAMLSDGVLRLSYGVSHAESLWTLTVVRNNGLVASGATGTPYYCTQVAQGDVFEVVASDLSGNNGQRWAVIVGLSRLTVARKGT